MRRRIYSGNPNGGHKVRFFDGLSVDPYAVNYVADGGTATLPPPPNPDPDYLIFSSWDNPSTNITSNQDIVATYNTVDGYTYAFLKVTKLTGKTLNMHFLTKSGTITIDWGDGIEETADADETVTDGYKKKHDYKDYGEYVVKIIYSGDSTFTLGYNDMKHLFVGTADITTNSSSKDMAMLTKLYVGYHTGSAAPMIMMYANLKYIVLPNDFTTVGNYFMRDCVSLEVAPSLNSVTTVGDYFMYGCSSLKSFTINQYITSLNNNFLSNNNKTIKIICEGSTPPTLMNTSLQPLNGCFAIYVPDTAVDTYKEATNWSYYADYIYPMSDMDK